ncbi:MAG: hypothetical protein ACE5R4_03425 [Armatimonadota bacterium]
MQLRTLIAVCAVLVVLMAALGLWSRYGHEPGRGVRPAPPRRQASTDEGLGLIVLKPPSGVGEKDEEGNWVWEAQFGGELEVDQKAGIVRGSEVTCTIPMGAEDTLEVTAGQFRADQGNRRLRFEQKARAELKPRGSYFLADAFDWAIDEQRLQAVSGVELRHESMKITGDKLEADFAAQTAVISGHPKATYEG